jgi:hypothetical protein
MNYLYIQAKRLFILQLSNQIQNLYFFFQVGMFFLLLNTDQFSKKNCSYFFSRMNSKIRLFLHWV